MTLRLPRRTLLQGTAAATLLAAAGRPALADSPLKVGFVYVGPVGDFGWTYRHDVGRRAVEDHFGDRVETTFVESVSEGPDAERVIRQLAASGHELIFTTSFGFGSSTLRVARQFADVKFEHATGYQRADNVATYAGRFHEGRAVVGTLAGMLTQSNRIGYIASFPIPEVIRGINATAIHARKVNPEAQVVPIWVNTWYDPGREAEAAAALISQGVDVMTQHTDSPAPVQAAAERGVPAVGQASDMRRFAPEHQITALIDTWGPYYIRRVQAVLDGTWTSTDTWEGFADGMVQLAEYGPMVTPEMAAAADAVRTSIVDGTYDPFQGPIMAQDGSVMFEDGHVPSDDEIRGMNRYVEGVVGSIPG
ncbi:MAG: BMP family ABC transporter substrate-binding protein [Geminicoccaceae bacterium]|nr:MAG: BMP family ABC transporter substrate-binding protein [Geminicoccaceae bacterium]